MATLLRPSIYWLFAFAPASLALEYSGASAPLVFFSSALSIIPIARLIGLSTEQLATYTGDAVGGLLNATFGNFPELIICIVALKAGLHDIVLASLVGAILANLLLATGVSFLVGGLKRHGQEYNPASIKVYSSMMLIAVFTLFVSSAFHSFFGDEGYDAQEDLLNIGLSITLLVAYVLYLVFMLGTHKEFFKSIGKHGHAVEHETRWPMKKALLFLIVASVGAAFMSELLVGAAEETGKVMGMSSVFIGVIFLAVIGGAAESISAVTMAAKNKMDLSVGIALGYEATLTLGKFELYTEGEFVKDVSAKEDNFF